jgi:lipoprotein-releasing system permease protein
LDEVAKTLSEIQGVKYVNPLVEAQAMITSPSKNAGGLIKGIRLQDLQNKQLISQNILAGDLAKINNREEVVIGSSLAQNMNLKIGDTLKIISGETNNSLLGAIPRVKSYKVSGVFESGMYEYDSTTIFMNFAMAQTHFKQQNRASAIEIFVDDATKLDEIKLKVFKVLTNYRGLYFVDWQQSNSSFIDALKVERTVMFLILTLIILVAAFNIISSMIMLVKDKNKNIALLRTMGMEKASILRIFLICGSSIGFVGTFFGFVIGVLFSTNINAIKHFLEGLTGANLFNPAIYFLSTLPAKVFVSDVVLIVSMSLIISFLATLYPAYKASKADPAEILRYE